jgi:FKBP-type peptidyl-prolyl cis-trans isomerase SlyD
MSDRDDAEEATDAADADEEETTGIQDGDFVRLAYTARTEEEDDLVDTTDEAVAEEADVDTEGQSFEPRVIVIGANQIFEQVESALIGGAVGDEGEVVVPAADAFGEYDEDDVRTISAERIPEDDRYPGAHVDVDGEHGHVTTIIGGRARVDFNHPLAGEDVEYEYEILDVVEDRLEQAQSLVSSYVDADLDMRIETDEVEEEVTVDAEDEDEEPTTETETVEKETLYIESTPQLQFNQQWMMGKQQIAQEIIDRLGVDRVIIQDVIEGGAAGPMGGMMGGMGGMGGGDIEEELEDADVDAEEIAEELGEDL